MIEAYKKIFTKACDFRNRTDRKTFWLAYLANVIVLIIMVMISYFIITKYKDSSLIKNIIEAVFCIYEIYTITGLAAMLVRRLHDTNKSAWIAILYVIPVLDLIPLILAMFKAETKDNKYGELV